MDSTSTGTTEATSSASTPREIIDFFLDPASYGYPVDRVEHHQTHVSHLFFAGDYVYKVKKPVDLEFLDFTTLDKRREAAVAELRLNRRIAPHIYLDVVAVHRDRGGRLSFTAPTHVEEVAVVMRRLPEERRLAYLVEHGKARPEWLVNLGRLVAHFHQRAETSPEIARYGSLDVVGDNWEENFRQTEPFIGRTIERDDWNDCQEEVRRFMRVYPHLFDERIDGGWIRDCHGDLLTDDIFIDAATGAPHVLDCIEFNARFRYSDTLADIAFLSMDLRHRGAPELAHAFLQAYYENSHDHPVPPLLRFYEAYRAFVRGKVKSIVIDEPEPSEEERREAADQARSFFHQAVADALALRPRLVLVAGIMGSGKTTLANVLGGLAGVATLHSDVVRKRLAGLEPDAERKVAFGEDIYSEEWTEKTYLALIDGARARLERGESVILDASWARRRHRDAARDAAREREAFFAIVECRAPDDVLRQRLSRDRPVTDARLELLDEAHAAYEAPEHEEAGRVLSVETVSDPHELAETLADQLFPAESPTHASS